MVQKLGFWVWNLLLNMKCYQYLPLLLLKPNDLLWVKTEYPATRKFYIHFSIDNSIANISLYALAWPKSNFGYYLTFVISF